MPSKPWYPTNSGLCRPIRRCCLSNSPDIRFKEDAMSTQTSEPTTGPKKTLSTTGVTINAMALIAPGAFLWITFQLQAAQTGPSGATTAFDMWQGIVFALVLAFLTAISYAEMAKVYPEAGFGS